MASPSRSDRSGAATSGPRNGSANPYDAFLSYAHEDCATVEWLSKLLASYWVPGFHRRRIFRDQQRIVASSLGDQIVEAPHSSQFLIVCTSKSTEGSDWVEKEVAEFLERSPPERLLLARVGSQDDDSPLPGFLAAAIRRRVGGLPYVPDLRGRPADARSRERRTYREEALVLLAPILGLTDREEVLAVRRRRTRLLSAVAGLLVVLTLAASGVWSWWLTTPQGRFFELGRSLTEKLRDQEHDEPAVLLPAARSLGRLDRRDLLERFAALTPEPSFRALYLATGYASLPKPDCAAASGQLTPFGGMMTSYPEVFLRVERVCGRPPMDTGPTENFLTSEAEHRARLLIDAGYLAEADAMIQDWQGEDSELLGIAVLWALESREQPSVDMSAALWSWRGSSDAHSLATKCLRWLEDFDLSGLLELPLAETLLGDCSGLTSAPDDLFNYWDLKQQFAGHLSGGQDPELAKEILDSTDPAVLDVITDRVYEDAAEGWAWRGLAQNRLGMVESANRSFDKAWEIASKPPVTSRLFSEWQPMAVAFALAGDWRRAFDTLDGPRDGRAQVEQGLYLIRIWDTTHDRKAIESPRDRGR